MAHPTEGSNHSRISRRNSLAADSEYFDGMMFGFQRGRVTDNKDPEFQGRVKANLEWMEEEGDEFETGWLSRLVPWDGPTKKERGRKFAFDGPLPEVGSIIVVGFFNGNPYDGFYAGMVMYDEGETGAPELDKDKHRDWSLRIALQNGFEIMVDTEGNTSFVIPGNLVFKVMGATAQFSCKGETVLMGTDVSVDAKSVLKLRGVTTDQTPYPRDEEIGEVRERTMDMYSGPPGREDPGIGKIERLE